MINVLLQKLQNTVKINSFVNVCGAAKYLDCFLYFYLFRIVRNFQLIIKDKKNNGPRNENYQIIINFNPKTIKNRDWFRTYNIFLFVQKFW